VGGVFSCGVARWTERISTAQVPAGIEVVEVALGKGGVVEGQHREQGDLLPPRGAIACLLNAASDHPSTAGQTTGLRTRNHRLCYTSFALSDLDVSGGLPLRIKAIQPGTDFPQAPTA
jgi:hypothetical protein